MIVKKIDKIFNDKIRRNFLWKLNFDEIFYEYRIEVDEIWRPNILKQVFASTYHTRI